jgi:PKD domain-containing protein
MRLLTLGVVSATAALLAGSAAAVADVPASSRVRARPATQHAQPTPAPRRPLPLRPSNPARLQAAKQAAERRRSQRLSLRGGAPAPRIGPFSSGPRVGLFNGLNQPGLDAQDSPGVTPPDTTGAIGPSHYVEMVNVAVAVYARANLGLVSGPLDLGVFAGAPAGTEMTDPQIQWDQQGRRWFYVTLAFKQDAAGDVVGPNFLQYGFSKTTNPSDLSGGWCRYSIANGSFGGQNLLDDYPKLGHDARHVLIGTNAFNEDGDFLTSRLWSLPKPGPGSLGSCPAPPVATTFGSPSSPLKTADGNTVFTPVPANTADASSAGYLVAADDPTESGSSGPRNQIMAWHVGGSAGAPTLVSDGNIAVPTYDIPPVAFQPVLLGLIDTLDGRLTNAVANADPTPGGGEAIWTQHTVDPGDGTVVVRWYELLPASHAARQQGTISDPANDVYNGAISPSASGSLAAINYNVSGPALRPEIRARIRGPATPLGQTTGELALAASEASALDVSCLPPSGPPCRWGDYAGASPDHSNPFVVWGSNQAIAAPGGLAPSWVTRNFAVGDRQPIAGFSFSPVAPGQGRRVTFSSSSVDPDGDALTQLWDLDGDGRFDDAVGATATGSFATAGAHTVRLRVADPLGVAALAVRSVVVRDTIAPRLRVFARTLFRIRTAIRRGVRFRVRSSEAGQIKARLATSRRTARRLRLSSRTLGRASARLGQAGTKRVKVKLSRKAKRGLRRLASGRRVRATLRVLVKDAAGNSTLVKRRIRLRR